MRLLLLLALLAAAPAFAQEASTTDDAPAWLHLDADGALRLVAGQAVVFEGVGHLRFDLAARTVAVDAEGAVSVVVSGAAVTPPATVRDADAVQVETADGARWTVRPATDADFEGEGTRIHDEAPAGPSRVDSETPTRFVVRVEADGASTFFYPDASG